MRKFLLGLGALGVLGALVGGLTSCDAFKPVKQDREKKVILRKNLNTRHRLIDGQCVLYLREYAPNSVSIAIVQADEKFCKNIKE